MKGPAPFMPGRLGAPGGACSEEGETVEMAHASSVELQWLTCTASAAGIEGPPLWRSIEPLTLAISPATASVELRNATPWVALGSSMMVTPDRKSTRLNSSH